LRLVFTIAGFLTDFTNGARQVEVDSASPLLADALQKLWAVHLGLRDRVLNEQGQIRQHVNIFLNNENVRRLQSLQTEVKEGDEITILPSVSGGCNDSR
jgi:molybdopterin synthase sulfur carrier subunit